MSWLFATVALALLSPFVFWPLVRHRRYESPSDQDEEARARTLLKEDIDYDLASGRLQEEDAQALLEEL